MSSEVGLAVGARMMHVHALVDAARNQATAEPAAKERNQKARNVRDEAGRSGRLRVDLGVATGTDHVRRLGSYWDDGRDDGWPRWLGHVRDEGTGRRDATDGLCIAGWGRRGRNETVRWWGFLAHLGIGFPFRRWQLLFLMVLLCPWFYCKNPLSGGLQLTRTRTRTYSTTPTRRIGQERTPDSNNPQSFTQFSPTPPDPELTAAC